MTEPISASVKHKPVVFQPSRRLNLNRKRTLILFFSRTNCSKTMKCLHKADIGLYVLALPACLLLGPSKEILYETLELKRHSFGPESFCC